MKRLLLIFLLCVVPFQFAWATAGAYCQHETGAAPKHFGHHAHHHQANAEKTETSYKVGKLHPDCGSCHGMSFALFQSLYWLNPLLRPGRTCPPPSRKSILLTFPTAYAGPIVVSPFKLTQHF
jgi:hypothetical protein